MNHTLPQLPFAFTDLAPWTSENTLSFHHGKHHAGYVSKLNTAIEGTEFAEMDLETVIKQTRGNNPGVFNNAAQHFNHSFFWSCLTAEAQQPSEALQKQIKTDFDSMEAFQEAFSTKAATLFGSGWTWLIRTPSGSLAIEQMKDAETPAGTENTPLLTLDVWEHAYYLDHQNARASFIEGFWKHVNWSFVSEQFEK